MLIQQLIERYKRLRKKKYLDQPLHYKHAYAFIGAGQHSFSNLYPAIHHLGIPLKIICTRTIGHAQKMATRFSGCKGTDDISTILEDKTIKGVFLSATPSSHATIVKQLLQAGKHVFVEKPPCLSLDELTMLIQNQGQQSCIPGLQKRFSTVNRLLKPQVKNTITYSYRYLTGAYTEGDPVFELFIHPIDNLVYLFGDVTDMHIQPSLKNDFSYFLSLTHANGISGMLHLSTDYSWKFPVDELEVNTGSAIFQANYPNKLVSIDKPGRFLNIPFEKILKTPVTKKVYLDNTGFVPVANNNQIALQGFLGEIEYFTDLTEGKQQKKQYDLQNLLPAYRILEKLKAHRGTDR